ncbi:MAG: hypothetical protein R6U10_05355, partial [Thermoplasmatota archaeon]
LSASVGVGETPQKSSLSFGVLRANESSFPRSVSVVNPSMLPVHGMVYASGSAGRFLDTDEVTTFSLRRGERFSGNVTAHIPAGTAPGVYTAHLYIYSTPYWSLVPLSAMESLHGWHPRGAVVALTLFSAVALASATFLLLAMLSFAVERWQLARGYLAWLLLPLEARMPSTWRRLDGVAASAGAVRQGVRRMFSRMHAVPDDGGGRGKPLAVSVACLLAAAPLLYRGYGIAAAVPAASLAGGVMAYAVGCRWRIQFTRAALLATAWFAGLYLATSVAHVFQAGHSLLVPLATSVALAGIILLVFAGLAVPVGLLFWLPGHLIHTIREKWNPVVLLRGCDL